jgi:tetratricopeptide (TPR) repeat protein
LKADYPREAEPLQAQVIAETRALGRWEQVRVLQVSHAQALALLGRHREAEQACREAVALAERVGMDEAAPGFDAFTLAYVLRDLGQYAEAIDRFAGCLETFRQLGAPAWIATCCTHAAQLWLRLGQPARAQVLLEPIDAGLPAFLLAHRRLVEAELQARSDPRAALILIDQALATLGPQGRAALRLVAPLLAARFDPSPAALQACRQARDEAARRGMQGIHVSASAVLGWVAAQTGAHDEAAVASAAAVDALAAGATPEWFTPGELAALCGRAFERTGHAARAREAARLGAGWLRRAAVSLPPSFHAGFLERHDLHREVLAAAAKRDGSA